MGDDVEGVKVVVISSKRTWRMVFPRQKSFPFLIERHFFQTFNRSLDRSMHDDFKKKRILV